MKMVNSKSLAKPQSVRKDNVMANDQREISNHILPSSSNLLGVCFLIFSIVKTVGTSQATWLDELSLVGVFVFLASSVLSYMSLRSSTRRRWLETLADRVFLAGLILLTASTVVVAMMV